MELITIYSSFLRLAQEDNGRFHTFLNFQRLWTDTDAVADPYGRAMWALGLTIYMLKASPFTKTLDTMFSISLRQTDNIKDTRTAANTILGLYYYILTFKDKKDSAIMAE